MRCPYCSNPAFESLAECPRCGFALHKLDALFGTIPRLSPGISDAGKLFSKRDVAKLTAEISRFEKKFPQLLFSIVTTNLAPGDNLAAYAFWIFNKAGVCRPLDKGGDNRNILLMIDAGNARASLLVGYGLEPFVGEKHLAAVIADAAPEFREGSYFEGTKAAIASLDAVLCRICSGLDTTYGICMNEIFLQDNAAKEAYRGAADSPY